MTTEGFSIRATRVDDWREVRSLRLEMLQDTPIAFGETLQDALGHTDSEWRMRAARGTAERGTVLVAIDPAGRWVGTMGGYVPDATTGALLVGVYVSPDHRGRDSGVFDALLVAIQEWARGEGDRLTLHVHEDNARARAAYLRRGFTETGHRVKYVLDSSAMEIEMVKPL
ncbi:GNAT family N-acetyltransferase [Cryobacterium sp. LW097]|uniref:GNAT family N-acetyltransferase n=1 Tax=unclassified Cryobacterium TaxID=2649013 RepID=UPI000B4CB8F6|nr:MULTISPECIES: GNAT family N-acetyltransferase [unclassified Cryobacterium]ASD22780.1 GNAT family N-acetyltransferase [Cryobacterium sp. LW097]TFC50394.1 GNAT family N-acetyltransferase [Cryobacterium sp. TMB3-1-2]TFC71871.1 GNAT family N-acetyltransferase [Cryobacterium sp. TMB3-15]TFC78464.1 GNAT family N-acetyltransferase [Cryobacterium sp. TMB3-10]TFC92273.1 GNAT family N-acetyltransferase [Cryobacterium sp. TMT4-31]